MLLILIPFLVSTAFAQVNIFVGSESVNLGDTINFQVNFDERINRSVEVMVVGKKDGKVLCRLGEGESLREKCGNVWQFEVPENWEEGIYHLKVLINDVTPEEYFKEFRVVKPKFSKIDLPEVVYQGKTKIKAYVDSANGNCWVEMNLMGQNFEYLGVKGRADVKEGENNYYAELTLNLRQFYERNRNIANAIETGEYMLEFKLIYGEKVWDTRKLTVKIVDPELKVSLREEYAKGEKIVISIESNRKYDYGYDGILVVIQGQNLLFYKKAVLDDDGKAEVQFETAFFDAGGYNVYVRDTSLTSTIPLSTLAKEFFDLSPKSSYAKIIHASDDVVISKKIWVLEDKREVLELSPAPLKAEIFKNESRKITLTLKKPVKITYYEFSIYLSDNLELTRIEIPEGVKLLEKSYESNRVFVKALNSNGSELPEIGVLEVKGSSVGEGRLTIGSVKIYGEFGEELPVVKDVAEILVLVAETPSRAEIEAKISVNSSSNFVNSTTVTATLTATPEPTQTESRTYSGIDYVKVLTFTAAFTITYAAGKLAMSRVAKKKGKGKGKGKR